MRLTAADFARIHGPDANVFTISAATALVIVDDDTRSTVGIVLDLVHRDTGQAFRQLYLTDHSTAIDLATEVGVCATVIRSGGPDPDHP